MTTPGGEKAVCGIDNVLQPTDIRKWVVASHEPNLVTGNNLREDISCDLWSQIQRKIGDNSFIIYFEEEIWFIARVKKEKSFRKLAKNLYLNLTWNSNLKNPVGWINSAAAFR